MRKKRVKSDANYIESLKIAKFRDKKRKKKQNDSLNIEEMRMMMICCNRLLSIHQMYFLVIQ